MNLTIVILAILALLLFVSFKGKFNINYSFGGGTTYQGRQTLNGAKDLKMEFQAGQLVVDRSTNGDLTWKFTLKKDAPAPELKIKGNSAVFQGSFEGLDAKLSVPDGVSLTLKGSAGRIEINQAQSPVDIDLSTGEVAFHPDSNLKYRYDTKVGVGAVTGLESSDDKKAIGVKINVGVGKIGR